MQIPVRINMGDTDPSNQKIGKRELYVYNNNGTYELWVGNSKGDAVQLTVGNAKTVDEETILDILSLDTSTKSLKPRSGTAETLDGFKLKNVQSIVLNESQYGTTLPDSGVEGQVFFKI